MIDGEDAATSSVSSSVVQPATEAAPPTPSAPSNRRRGSGIMGGFLPQVSVEQPALSTGQTILIRLEPLGDVPRGIYMGLFEAAVNGAIDRFRSVFALVSEHVVTAARCVSLRPKPPTASGPQRPPRRVARHRRHTPTRATVRGCGR